MLDDVPEAEGRVPLDPDPPVAVEPELLPVEPDE
jgi:hypothetical protein